MGNSFQLPLTPLKLTSDPTENMRLDSTEPPIYSPEADQSTVLRLGVQPLDFSQWILPAQDLAVFHRHKQSSRAQYGDRVYQALPDSEPAQLELKELLLQHLLAEHGAAYVRAGDELRHHPSGLTWDLEPQQLWFVSCWVQEDLCIMEEHNGEYLLTAASVCSPSNWKLEEKIGRNLDFIHDPVTGYKAELAPRVNRLFNSLKPEKPLVRLSWSMQNDNELFWRKDLGLGVTGSQKYWRVERQTLRRLPKTGAIVFTIRVSLHSFSRMAQQPGFDDAVAAILARLPQEQKQYKGLQ
ncbi:MAG: DUF3445 domain-containing protein [Pseudohongiellaceae bacterium]